jgi:hypothetical protein
MKQFYILCEGQTEDDFVNIILNPYLQSLNVFAVSIICTTKRTSTKKFKGGVSSYGKIRNELKRLCGEHPNEMVTTMFDFYGLPHDTPHINYNINDIYEKAKHIEKAIKADLGNLHNVCINLILHEFEGLLFSDVNAFKDGAKANDSIVAELRKIRNKFDSPEHINDSEKTAPSKRIKNLLPEYSKNIDGIEVAQKIGIDGISADCKHFRQWIEKLATWAKEGSK